MGRWIVVVVVLTAVSLFGFSLVSSRGGDVGVTNVVMDASSQDTSGFARAFAPRDWSFPQNFGAHPEYQTEWWYYTGNVTTTAGERIGFQFTIFRRALQPQDTASDSEWRSAQMYMVHFTVSDIARGRFWHDERYSRGGADLAGATGDPYRVWVEDWQIIGLNDEATLTRITADAGDFAIDLTLDQVKPPALQGNQGLSAKSGEAGNASYYYSLSRLVTDGTIRIGDTTHTVSGVSWKDHEFGTSALGPQAQGWDWFGLIFENEYELMVGQIRQQDDSVEPAFGGLLIRPDGSTLYLPAASFTITPLDTWTSPHTGAVYPSGWTITVAHEDIDWTFTVTPLMRDQELHGANVEYWEGAVDVTGDVTGVGYAELTGYVDTMQGRF